MKLRTYSFILLTCLLFSCSTPQEQFEATAESLQNYKTPEWFRDAKFGIWVCWNAYTVPAVGDWYARNMYIEGHRHYKYHVENYGHPSEFGYKDIIHLWKGEKFNAEELVDLFVKTGAKYVIGMANHHDNFDLWDSKYHEWNSVSYGPKRDIMAEMKEAVMKYRDQGIRWGMTSHLERTWSWFQTNKGADKEGPYAGVPYDGNDNNYAALYLPPDPNGDAQGSQPTNAPLHWRKEWLERCKDLIDNYDPDMFYVDGGVPFPGDDKGHTGLEMISYLYNKNAARHNGQNEAVMCIKDWTKLMPNGEWGHYWDGIATLDLERTRLPQIRKQPWQTDTSIGPWTYVKGAKYRSATDIIHELVDVVSKNGNLLLNVTPMSNGELDEKASNLLKEIGAWMMVNGESIYETRPWIAFGKDDIRIVCKGDNLLYVTLLKKLADNKVSLHYLIPDKGKSLGINSISALGFENQKINWQSTEEGLSIELPDEVENPYALVLKIQGSGFENFDETPLQSLHDRSEELKLWWSNQLVTKTKPDYKKVTSNWQNRTWAITANNSFVELINGMEEPVHDIKALDIGANERGIVYCDLNGAVLFSSKGEQWSELSGMKAKRVDVDRRGGVWIINQYDQVAYYANNKWNVLDKKAEDIGCGMAGRIAIISNGKLEKFEGNKWENLGGKNLKAVDFSVKNDVMVVLDTKGKVALHDGMEWAEINTDGARFSDVGCGKKNDDETVVLVQRAN